MKNSLTLILGASLNKNRYAYLAAKKLSEKGIKALGIGLKEGKVYQVPIVKNWEDIKNVNTITIYLSAKNQKPYYKKIIASKANKVIFNPGAENKELEDLLDQVKIRYERACTLVLLSTNQF